MTLLFPPRKPPTPAEEKTRNRVGIKALIDRNILKGQRVTLEEAIAILRANW